MTCVAPDVLVVDDDDDIKALIREVLEEEGYAVVTATGGAAVPLAVDARPAVVLLDLMMPVMDGYEVGRRLRADPHTADVPIIVMSASTRAWQAVSQIGADGYLEKPFDLTMLLRTVAAYAR
jgi:CheY-like chemotaxis protein